MQVKRREKQILFLCICYFMYVFFYGIIVKITISNNLLFQIKTYIPEVLLLVIMIECVMQGKLHIKKATFYLLTYSILVFIFNLFSFGLNEQALYLVRDIYIPLFAFSFIIEANITEHGTEYFFNKIIPLLKIYLILGLTLAVIEQIRGWEWTSQFYTGYSFYGQDPYSKVKIAHNLGLLRAPSLSGNFATFGYYCLIADIIIRSRTKTTWKRLLWDVVALVCMVLATNKSAVVVFAVIIILGGTSAIRSKSARLNKFIIAGVIAIVLVYSVWLFGDNSDGSSYLTGLFQRFDVWDQLIDQVTWPEMLFPYRQFSYGTGAEGAIGFWDNTYFYFLFTQGVVGAALWFVILKDRYKNGMQAKDETIRLAVYYMTIAFLVLGITVNVTQGRGFFSLYLVFLGIARSIRGGYSKD